MGYRMLCFCVSRFGNSDWITAGHKSRTTGSAYRRAYIRTGKSHSFFSHAIKIGSTNIGRTEAPHIVVALVIGQDDQHVGPSGRRDRGGEDRQPEGQQDGGSQPPDHFFFAFFPVNSAKTCSMFSSRVFTSTPVHFLYHGRSIEVLISSSVLPSSMDFWMACRNSTKYRF